MLITVIPFSHSLTLDPYTYSVPDIWRVSICLGGLVEIPFGKNIDTGIIASIEPSIPAGFDPESIKPILRVIASIELLSLPQISMILAIAHRYFIPLHRVLRMFLPAPLLSRLDKKNYILNPSDRSPQRENHQRKKIIEYSRDRAFSREDVDSLLHPGSVIIFPDDFFLYTLSEKLAPEIAICPAEATPVRKSKFWIDAYEGREKIIVWTRRLLYYNLERYDHLYYLEDAFWDEDYQYPTRLRNLDILRIFTDQNQFDITIITSSPTLELLAQFRDFSLVTR